MLVQEDVDAYNQNTVRPSIVVLLYLFCRVFRCNRIAFIFITIARRSREKIVTVNVRGNVRLFFGRVAPIEVFARVFSPRKGFNLRMRACFIANFRDNFQQAPKIGTCIVRSVFFGNNRSTFPIVRVYQQVANRKGSYAVRCSAWIGISSIRTSVVFALLCIPRTRDSNLDVYLSICIPANFCLMWVEYRFVPRFRPVSRQRHLTCTYVCLGAIYVRYLANCCFASLLTSTWLRFSYLSNLWKDKLCECFRYFQTSVKMCVSLTSVHFLLNVWWSISNCSIPIDLHVFNYSVIPLVRQVFGYVICTGNRYISSQDGWQDRCGHIQYTRILFRSYLFIVRMSNNFPVTAFRLRMGLPVYPVFQGRCFALMPNNSLVFRFATWAICMTYHVFGAFASLIYQSKRRGNFERLIRVRFQAKDFARSRQVRLRAPRTQRIGDVVHWNLHRDNRNGRRSNRRRGHPMPNILGELFRSEVMFVGFQ